jgi:hypothetical protein
MRADRKPPAPSRSSDACTARSLVDDVLLGAWFEDSDRIDAVTRVRHDPVADRHRVGYRFRLTDSDRVCAVQQQAYNEVDDDRISWLHVLCAGFRPVSATASH